ncbi:Uric acid degradation bifunctional protein TTL [Acorus calamus]|uniref:Uric acid degradation bifunctional protein TTL n=1 Tax=Acorus calamus TaxID=4465 RepID=A0AAV9DYM2_ACOCL|nr:Uric acid degradation bifunctional protein TTL [Acorus calamus]
MDSQFDCQDFLSCCGSTRFAREMVAAGPFSGLDQALEAARHIWMNIIDVNGCLEAFAAHPEIGSTSSASQWSKQEQSTALATATDHSLQELLEWNSRYKQKFGHVFLICASGRGSPEILAELKVRYHNRPIVELEIAAQEQMKITELRLAKLFASKANIGSSTHTQLPASQLVKPGAHLTANPKRTRPPITTHVLDVSRGSPASGIEVQLEMWKGTQLRPSLAQRDSFGWVHQGSSITDSDGRSGPLMGLDEFLSPGVYRISFNTGKYSPGGFFPYVSIVFEVRESQRSEHFHVPLLLSPFSFSTYRGS